MEQKSSPGETKGTGSTTSLERIVIRDLSAEGVQQMGYQEGYCAAMGHYMLFYFQKEEGGVVYAKMIKMIIDAKKAYYIVFQGGIIQVDPIDNPQTAKLKALMDFEWNEQDTRFIEQLSMQRRKAYSHAVYEAIRIYREKVKPLSVNNKGA